MFNRLTVGKSHEPLMHFQRDMGAVARFNSARGQEKLTQDGERVQQENVVYLTWGRERLMEARKTAAA